MSVPFSTKQFAGPDSPFPTRRIPLADVRYSQHPSVMDEAKIERMRKTWSSTMAPPVVAERDGQLTVLDGHHRVEAARRRGLTYLKAKISE